MARIGILITVVGLLVTLTACGNGRLAERRDAATTDTITTTTTETEAENVSVATTDDDALAEELAAATDAPYTAPSDGSVVVNSDIYYGNADSSKLASEALQLNSLDIYAPPTATAAPVMVMIHGGGWQTGDKRNQGLIENKMLFFTDNGWLFVSINYRLSPAVQHPAHVEDVAMALAWLQAHVADYGGDPDNFYIMGHSAGAHLAALVATDERYLTAQGQSLAMLDGVILLDGAGYNVATQTEYGRGRLQEMYLNAFTDDPAVWEDASPINHVATDKGIPPFFVSYVARRDPARIQSERLVAQLQSAGVPATLYAAENKSHMTINQEFGLPDDPVTTAAWAWLQAQ